MGSFSGTGSNYKLIILLLLLLPFNAFTQVSTSSKPEVAQSQKKMSQSNKGQTIEYEPSDSLTKAENIICYSKLYLGRPYRRGSKGPGGFDCSGFTSFVFRKFGYSLGASSGSQAVQGDRLKETDHVKPGDLIFFKGRNSKADRVGHVGIVISNEGNGNLKFIHAECNVGISIDDLNKPYYKTRYVGCSRILEESPRFEMIGDYMAPAFPNYEIKYPTPPAFIKIEKRN